MLELRSKSDPILALFFISGFGSLIYESIWTHYLKLFLGHAAYAQTVVLVVFIGGLALGAWICALLAPRIVNPLRWYAAVELVVGLLALVFHSVFVAATEWGYSSLLPATCDAASSTCVAQWLLSAALLLPQSILIGATFPLVSSAVLRLDPTMPGHHVAMLYFLNSFGAVLGVLASIFVLIPAFGLPGTLQTAGVLNIALAAAALLLARLAPPPFAVTDMATQSATAGETQRSLLVLLLATAFLTGLSSFVYEIAWIRMLSLVLGASTSSFELMLASFILGLALGGLWVRRRIDSIGDPIWFLGLVQIAMGVAAAATLPLYIASFDLMAWMLSSLGRNTGAFLIFNAASMGIALLVMLPATFCAGMTLPLITYRLLRSRSGERALGLVYSVNTVGAIAGVVLAVHLLMTWIGMRGALLVGAAIDVVLGVALLAYRIRGGAPLPRAALVASAAVVILAFIAVAVPIDARRGASGVFRTGAARVAETSSVEFHRDGKTATVDVITSPDGTAKSIRTNGKSDAAIQTDPGKSPLYDELTMAMLALMPLGHNPQAQSAAVIGFGSGMSTHVLLGSPVIRQVESIEIEPAMVQGARTFLPAVDRAYTDPRSLIVIDDAKSYFARAGRRYDIIVSEPSNPWVSGVSSLFSEEFYRRIAASLNEGGVLSQWLHSYDMDAEGLASIFNAVAKSFPDFAVYSVVDSDIILVARKGGPLEPFDESVLRWPGVAPTVRRLTVGEPGALSHRVVGSSASVLGFYGPLAAANSDYYPILEHRVSRTRFTKERVTDLADLQASPVPVLEMLDGGFRPLAARPAGIKWSVAEYASVDGWDYRAVILDPAPRSAGEGPAADSREHAARLIGLSTANCSGISFTGLLPSAVALAGTINPHLPSAAALDVWHRLERSPCSGRLTETERRWLRLLAAVAGRDAAAMAQVGSAVLEERRGKRDSLSEYALLAATTGFVCQGRTAEATRLFERARAEWLPSGPISVALRYVFAMGNLPSRPVTAACPAPRPS
jgi:spermidine synthase